MVPISRTEHLKPKKNITMADPIAGSSDMAIILTATPLRKSLRDVLVEDPIEGFHSIMLIGKEQRKKLITSLI
jgi:hypothetical protein